MKTLGTREHGGWQESMSQRGFLTWAAVLPERGLFAAFFRPGMTAAAVIPDAVES